MTTTTESAIDASSAFNTMLLQRKMEFGDNANTCMNYFTDGCSYPWCDMCNGYVPKESENGSTQEAAS